MKLAVSRNKTDSVVCSGSRAKGLKKGIGHESRSEEEEGEHFIWCKVERG